MNRPIPPSLTFHRIDARQGASRQASPPGHDPVDRLARQEPGATDRPRGTSSPKADTDRPAGAGMAVAAGLAGTAALAGMPAGAWASLVGAAGTKRAPEAGSPQEPPAGTASPTRVEPAARRHVDSALFDSPTLHSASVFPLPNGLVTGSHCTALGGLPVHKATTIGVLDPERGGEMWTQDLPPGVHSKPVVSPDGTRIALGGWGWVHLHDSATGEIVGDWQHGHDELAPRFDARGRLIVSEWDGGGLALLEEGRSQPVWAVERDELPEGLASGPDGSVYQTGWHKPTRALDGETGARKWKGPEGVFRQGNPVVGPDGTLVSRCDGGDLVAVDTAWGNLLWRTRPGDRLEDPVLSADGQSVVVPVDKRGLTCLDLASGEVRWHAASEEDRSEGPLVGSHGEVVLGDRSGRIYVLDAAQGVLLETGRVPGPVRGLTPLPDGELAVVDGNDQVHLLSAAPPEQERGIEQGEEFVVIGDVKISVRR